MQQPPPSDQSPNWNNQPPTYPPYAQQQPFPPQPPSYYPPQQPLYAPLPPPPPKRPWIKRHPILTFLIVLFALGVVQAAVRGGSGTTTTDTSSNTSSSPASTPIVHQQAPTPKPTSKPKPAPTAKPLTIDQRVTKLAKDATTDDIDYSVYDKSTKSATVSINQSARWDDAGNRDAIKENCFNVQKALWTATPSLKLEEVVVFLNGEVTDQYGKTAMSQVGHCALKKNTEQKFHWDGLTWSTAWPVYDYTSMLPSLDTD